VNGMCRVRTRAGRHFHTIWLLAKGHTLGEVAEMTSFGQRWIEQLAARRYSGQTLAALEIRSARRRRRLAPLDLKAREWNMQANDLHIILRLGWDKIPSSQRCAMQHKVV
jgi:hypothetical protein